MLSKQEKCIFICSLFHSVNLICIFYRLPSKKWGSQNVHVYNLKQTGQFKKKSENIVAAEGTYISFKLWDSLEITKLRKNWSCILKIKLAYY